MPFTVSLLTSLTALLVYLKSGKIVSDRNRLAIRAISLLILALAVLATVFRNVVVVSAGEVGVNELMGRVNSNPLKPGVHLVNPFSDVTTYSTRMQEVKETIEATSREGLAFNVDVSLQYRIDPQKAVEIYQMIGDDEEEIVISRFRSIVREVTATYPAEAIYSTKRQEVAGRIQQRVGETLAPIGVTVDGAFLREVVLPETLQTAIQEKLKVEQESRQMTSRLEQARQEAERKRIEAQGTADAQAIISRSLTEETLQLRAIEAMEKLGASNNAKVVVIGGEGGMPISLPLNQGGGE